jgi:hypothetical protein
MAAGDPIPGSHHVGRYVKNTWIVSDPITGLRRADQEAFAPRPDEPEGVSVNHLEHFRQGDVAQNVLALEHHLRGPLGRNLKKNGGFATGLVEALITAAARERCEVRIVEDPLPGDPSHALISGAELMTNSLAHAAIAGATRIYPTSTF